MVDAEGIGQTEKGPIMDAHNDEQTEILRGMWKDMVEANKSLNAKIDQTNATLSQMNASLSQRIDQTNATLSQMNASLSQRIDQTNSTLSAFMQQTHENFGRVHRNFDKVNTRLEQRDLGSTRVDDLDARLTRVETHVGLRED